MVDLENSVDSPRLSPSISGHMKLFKYTLLLKCQYKHCCLFTKTRPNDNMGDKSGHEEINSRMALEALVVAVQGQYTPRQLHSG